MTTASEVTGTSTAKRPAAVSCHVCGAETSIAVHGPPAIVRCSACGLTALEAFPGDSERVASYQEDYYSAGTGARFLGPFEWVTSLLRTLRLQSILRRAPGPGAVLDVGCGRGDLLELFQRRGWRALGTQVSATAARAARELRGVEVLCGELPDLGLSPASFDVIAFFHVLEHLPRPDLYLQCAHALLAPGGLLVVEVPDCSSLAFRLLPLRNLCLDHPNHLFFFTPRSLRGLLERVGFHVVGESRFSLEHSPYTALQNLLNLLPGAPNRLYRSLMRNAEGRRLRRSPWTWVHGLAALCLALPALLASLLAVLLPPGNTLRFYCRKRLPS
ncbi:MAG: class I SAM-dependent methyltransferase [Planctomycetes bacterium]|nr:class I SAM-dependent methyltransferase [Planctomycetota bacterium]